jgi:RHS repeat-associated protein
MSQMLPEIFDGVKEAVASGAEDLGQQMEGLLKNGAQIAEDNVERLAGVDANVADSVRAIGDQAGAAAGDVTGGDPAAGGLGDLSGGGSAPGAVGGVGGVAGDGAAGAASGSEGSASRAAPDVPAEGDPVDMATGDVVMRQADVRLPGTLSLVVERAHRSSYRAGRWFGRSWVSTLDQRLEVTADGVFLARADGSVLSYPHPGGDGEPVWPVSGARWRLAREGSGYTVADPQAGVVRRFEPRSGYYLSPGGLGELPLVSVTGRAGDRISFEYDLDGAPAAVGHDGGYHVRAEVAGGHVTGLVLAGAGEGGQDLTLVRYAYDEAGNLAEVINSSQVPLRFSYDQAGRLSGWQDRNGWWYRYTYDRQGRCVRGEGTGGMLSATFGYDPERRTSTHTDAAGAVTVYEMTEDSRVAAVTDPLGHVTRSEYDQFGRLVSRTDPLGRVTAWSYDQAGNVTSLTRPDGSQTTASYNDQNLPVVIREPGAAWQQEFDARGNPVRVTGPDGALTSYSYDERGHLAALTDPLGGVTVVASNPAGLPIAVTAPDGATTRYQRDGLGRVSAITAPDGLVTRLTWTTEGQLASRTLPDGTVEQFTYDGHENLVAYLDPAGGVTRFEYGYLDQVSARTGPDGTRTQLGYDQALRLTSVTHAGLTWRYEYDPAGRPTAQTDYNGSVTRYAYDAAGQLTGRVNAAGQRLSYAYDLLGRLTERRAGHVITTFGYDQSGRVTEAVNPDAVIVLERDASGRVTAETCNGRTVRSGYDRAGQRVERLTPSGAQTRWAYDAVGRPVALSAAGQELRFGYDSSGRETLRHLPGGATLTQEWDPSGQLAAQLLTAPSAPAPPQPEPPVGPAPAAARVLQRRGYSYRPDGVLAGIEDLLAGPRQLTLDRAGQVTGVTGADWAESYGYDRAGNITAAAWPAPLTGRHPDAAPDWPAPSAGRPPDAAPDWPAGQGSREYAGTLVTRAGDIRYEHDQAGRIILRQHARLSRKPDTWRYEWDAEDRLTAVTTPDGTRWQYLYDPLGRRVAKQRTGSGGKVTWHSSFTWDGPVLAEQVTADASGAAAEQVTTWDHQPGTFTPLTQAERWLHAPESNAQTTAEGEVDQRFYAIVSDLIGTPTELVGPDGDLAGHQQHTLWGTTYWAGAATPLRFPGQYEDPETGLHYNHHRYYDPATGRYLSPDPLGLGPAANPHAYVPNPTGFIDPLGLAGLCETGTAGQNAPGDPANLRTYHRLESPSQPPEVARQQVESGEVWGRPPRGSDIPKVQAYDGPLPAGRRGIEFTTDVPPDPRGIPGQPTWAGPRPGVRVEGDFAKIKVHSIWTNQA